MPVFFFNIHDGQALPDQQGLEFEDVAEAQGYALQIAGSFLNQDPDAIWSTDRWTVEICDGRQATLCTLRLEITNHDRQRHGLRVARPRLVAERGGPNPSDR